MSGKVPFAYYGERLARVGTAGTIENTYSDEERSLSDGTVTDSNKLDASFAIICKEEKNSEIKGRKRGPQKGVGG